MEWYQWALIVLALGISIGLTTVVALEILSYKERKEDENHDAF